MADCEKCGGPIWDNTAKAAGGNWKGPLLKCKDESCGWKKWPPKGQGGGNGGGNAKPRITTPLGPLYLDCMKIAAGSVKSVIGEKATPQDIIAATATLFIGATNTGAPLRATPNPAEGNA